MPRTAILPPVVVLCVLLISAAPVLGQGQAPTLGLEDLGLGDLGGMGGLGLLGALGGLGGGLSGAAPAPAQTIIIAQPAMLIHGNSLYIAYQGTVVKLNLDTLEKEAEATYWKPPFPGPAGPGVTEGLRMLPPEPGAPRPPLVPGATPPPGP